MRCAGQSTYFADRLQINFIELGLDSHFLVTGRASKVINTPKIKDININFQVKIIFSFFMLRKNPILILIAVMKKTKKLLCS